MCYFYRTVIYVCHVYLIDDSSRVRCVAMFGFGNCGRCVVLLCVRGLIRIHSNDCLRLGTHYYASNFGHNHSAVLCISNGSGH